eukprot:gene14938-15076_t
MGQLRSVSAGPGDNFTEDGARLGRDADSKYPPVVRLVLLMGILVCSWSVFLAIGAGVIYAARHFPHP